MSCLFRSIDHWVCEAGDLLGVEGDETTKVALLWGSSGFRPMTSAVAGAPTFPTEKCGEKKAPYKSIGIQAAAAFDPTPSSTGSHRLFRTGAVWDRHSGSGRRLRSGDPARLQRASRHASAMAAEFDGSETHHASKRTEVRDGSTCVMRRLTIHSTLDSTPCTHARGWKKTRRGVRGA